MSFTRSHSSTSAGTSAAAGRPKLVAQRAYYGESFTFWKQKEEGKDYFEYFSWRCSS